MAIPGRTRNNRERLRVTRCHIDVSKFKQPSIRRRPMKATFTTITKSLAAVALIAATCSASAQNAGIITQRGLSVNAAIELAQAALERCRADGFKVTITVLNHHATTSVVLSEDGVNPHTVENSMRKAYTAFTTRTPTVEMAKRAQPGLAGFMLLDKISPLDGALPIFAGKDLVGAVGISGAPGGDKDSACAKAGIDKIARFLN
jgi:uncharacterized protein GlcG (DUF336 family)